MKSIKSNDSEPFENSISCRGTSYKGIDSDMDGALIRVNARYPANDYLVNDVCKELVYITSGEGHVLSANDKIAFKKGDVICINPGEIFAWDGNFEGFFVCTPVFYLEQHREVSA